MNHEVMNTDDFLKQTFLNSESSSLRRSYGPLPKIPHFGQKLHNGLLPATAKAALVQARPSYGGGLPVGPVRLACYVQP
jgi:hypothetical protein